MKLIEDENGKRGVLIEAAKELGTDNADELLKALHWLHRLEEPEPRETPLLN